MENIDHANSNQKPAGKRQYHYQTTNDTFRDKDIYIVNRKQGQ